MRCPSCGVQNEETNRFCSHCGTRLQETPLFVLHPTALFVAARYLLTALLIFGILLLFASLERARPGAIPTWIVLLLSVLMFLWPLSHHLARALRTYTLTEQDLTLSEGVLRRIHRRVPLRKIQEVTVIQSGWERLLGIGDIVIDTAAEADKIVLRDVRHPKKYADLILHQIERT